MAESTDSPNRQLSAAHEHFFVHLSARVGEIKACWDDITGGGDDGTAVQKLGRLVHDLLDTSRKLGFETLSEPSQALEAVLKPLLDGSGAVDAAKLPRLAGLVMDLQQSAAVARELELDAAPAEPQPAPAPQRPVSQQAPRPPARPAPAAAAQSSSAAPPKRVPPQSPRPVPSQPQQPPRAEPRPVPPRQARSAPVARPQPQQPPAVAPRPAQPVVAPKPESTGAPAGAGLLDDQLAQAVAQMDWNIKAGAHEVGDADWNLSTSAFGESDSQVVFVVDPDSEMREFLSLQLGQRGYDVRNLSGPADALQGAQRETPAVVITEMGFPIGEMAGADAVEQLQRAVRQPFAVVFLSSRGDMAARVRAIRAGSDAYFTKPVDVAKLAEKLKLLMRRPTVETPSVLIVDDDATHNIRSKAILEKAGMRAATITDPMQLMQFLDAFGPDLILLDLYMPGADGLDLVRVLRQREDTADIPVVFVSGETDLAKQMVAMNLGGDEFLTKPVKPEHLVSMVRTRIHRARALRESIARLESQDPLTGLYNRRFFHAQLEEALRSGGQGAVLYIVVNGRDHTEHGDGPLQSDEVLAEVAKALRAEIGQEGVLARYSDWAFIALLGVADPDAARARAAATKAAFQRTMVAMGVELPPASCSIGISLLSLDVEDPDAVISSARAASEKARHLGSSGVHVDTASRLRLVDDVEAYWRHRIAHSLKEQDFHIAYQPIIALRGTPGKCYQSLLRMVDAHGDIMDAGDFIGHAERTGQVVEVDRWTAWNAVRLLVARAKESKPITLFLPTSIISALSEGYLRWIRKLKSSGLPPHSLVLELDTAAAGAHLSQVEAFIADLAELQVSTCLTGFGAAEDAFSIARRLSAVYLKLNRSLVQELAEQGRDGARLPGIAAEAHTLARKVIVPFVSDCATMSPLWHCDVDYVQGYFIQEPSEALAS